MLIQSQPLVVTLARLLSYTIDSLRPRDKGPHEKEPPENKVILLSLNV